MPLLLLNNVLVLTCCTLAAAKLNESQKRETLQELGQLFNDEALESLFNVFKTHDLAQREQRKKEDPKKAIITVNDLNVEEDAEGYRCADHDSLSGETCKSWQKIGLCKERAFRGQMKKYCEKTCELCTPPAPPIPETPACALTEYGCCWDKKKAAVGKNQKGCLPCKDKYKFLCANFASDCSSKLEKGFYMRLSCPETCHVDCDSNLNVHKCKDDKTNQQNCINWARDGACNKAPQKMRAYCQYTCGFCTGPPS